MTPHEFIQKWQSASLSERSAYQQHFLDLCELLGQPKPAAADPDGAWYTFERGVHKTDGGNGWADVWMRRHFGWEYKGKHKNLAAAYQQLLKYREDLENPPLLIVCDLDRFEIHTNFTNTAKIVHKFDLSELAEPNNLRLLRQTFSDPEALRPEQTTEGVTKKVAELIGQIADGLRLRGIQAKSAAHFLMKLMFSMFAEDIELLKNKEFGSILKASKDKPAVLAERMQVLFDAMSKGGYFGADEIHHFNGGLFADSEVITLRLEEIQHLVDANSRDWSSVEPSIFGTLFERTLNPEKLGQIGRNYTGRADIETLLEPLMMQPLRREWETVKTECEKAWAQVRKKKKSALETPISRRKKMAKKQSGPGRKIEMLLSDFSDRLAEIKVLDPACGSGNFLYVALHLLLDLNKEMISYAARRGLTFLPAVRPTQLAGIEIDEYAQELASVVIWIGYLQWMRDNGFSPKLNPVLERFESIKRKDAILDLSSPSKPKEQRWPPADFIVGNPPFLGSTDFRENGFTEEDIAALSMVYELHGKSDLCCYWFERALRYIRKHPKTRVGFLATQSIRHGGSRQVLERITQEASIFFAESDRPWLLDGAAVRVSMIGFGTATDQSCVLDGQEVIHIFPDLTGDIDVTGAKQLSENQGISFEGDQKGGPFNAEFPEYEPLLRSPNPNGKPNSDVIRPRANADRVFKSRNPLDWIIDFEDRRENEAALYEQAFEVLRNAIDEERKTNANAVPRSNWWIHKCPRPELRERVFPLSRYLVTPRVGRRRIFVWLSRAFSQLL